MSVDFVDGNANAVRVELNFSYRGEPWFGLNRLCRNSLNTAQPVSSIAHTHTHTGINNAQTRLTSLNKPDDATTHGERGGRIGVSDPTRALFTSSDST